MKFLQGKLLVKISMKTLEKVADSVLALTVPDERTISFTAGQLSMTLGRYSLHRLSGLKIKAGKGRFILPSKSQLLLSGVNKTSFVNVQVSIPALQANFNPSFFFFFADTDTSQVKIALKGRLLPPAIIFLVLLLTCSTLALGQQKRIESCDRSDHMNVIYFSLFFKYIFSFILISTYDNL